MPSCRQFGIRITVEDDLRYLIDVQIQRPRPPFNIARRQLGVSLTTGRCSMQDDVLFEKRRAVPKAFSAVRRLLPSSCRCNLIALDEQGQGAIRRRSAFAIGDALAVSFDHLVGPDHDGSRHGDAERLSSFE
jgi:hypothetical protein